MDAAKLNTEIASLVGDPSHIFLMRPSLEAQLGIGRTAPDKPRRVVEALENQSLTDIPSDLVDAVLALFA